MNTNRIFIGNLMCNEEFIGMYVFLKVGEEYVFLDKINNLLDVLNIKNNKIFKFGTINNGYYYIDKDSLINFYSKAEQKSLRKIKYDYLLDARNPRGIERY